MSKRHFLDFEQPIAELETKIDELRYVQNESAVDISEEIARLERSLWPNDPAVVARLDAVRNAIWMLDGVDGL